MSTTSSQLYVPSIADMYKNNPQISTSIPLEKQNFWAIWGETIIMLLIIILPGIIFIILWIFMDWIGLNFWWKIFVIIILTLILGYVIFKNQQKYIDFLKKYNYKNF